MAYWNRNDGSFFVDPPILANTGAEINVANRNAHITSDYISPNSELKLAVPAGLFVATINGVDRFLPRAKTSTLVSAASSTTVTLSPYNVFVPGDVLYTVEPYTTLTITATTPTQTQTITVDGITATATATTSSVTTTASEVVTAINNTPGLNTKVYALSTAGVVNIYAKDGETIYTVTEGGTVTATLSSATMSYQTTAVGTISSINYTTGVVTFNAAAGVTVPVGANIGVAGIQEIKGLHIHAVDFTVIKNRPISLYTVASAVRTQFLPYFDGTLVKKFPKMLFGTTF
jgi:hypothetical protein